MCIIIIINGANFGGPPKCGPLGPWGTRTTPHTFRFQEYPPKFGFCVINGVTVIWRYVDIQTNERQLRNGQAPNTVYDKE